MCELIFSIGLCSAGFWFRPPAQINLFFVSIGHKGFLGFD
jgi:hypothetical protein